ncbi:MAG: murein hydrolase activator EnvC [Campylobacterales bacterium]
MNKTAVLVSILLMVSGALYAKSLTEIDREIAGAKNRLQKSESREESLQSRVDNLSSEVAAATKELDALERELKQNTQEMAALENNVEKERGERERLAKERDRLILDKEQIERKLVDLLANHLSQSLVLSRSEPSDAGDLVREELFSAVQERSKKEIAAIEAAYRESDRALRSVENRISQMQNRLEKLAEAKKRQSDLLSDQAKLVAELDRRKSRYLSDLNTLIEQKNRERQMLADLRIVRQKTVDQLKQEQLSRQEAARREAQVKADQSRTAARRGQEIAVKQYGTSYQKAGKGDYRGRKVKPPLDDRHPISLIKEFGPYTDPIYNIKIHNDSVTLRSGQGDAVVRSVLPGKVVFADDLKLLGKVVIVEHSGNMHTIYRNLETISPNIRIDRNIKARESIGRVSQELVFEVTKDGLPINPMQLIALN